MSGYGLTAKQLAEFCASPPEPEEGEEAKVTPDLGTIGQDLFYAYLPGSPDTCVSIFDTGGWQKDPDLPRKDITFQFRIRGATYDDAQALAGKIYSYFCPDGLPKRLFYIDSFFVQQVLPMQPIPFYMGRDENDRDEFSWNMTFIIR